MAALFAERSTPELLCLEVRWASLMSYGLTVSLDGGYVHARSSEHCKDGSFEVIVGKSATGEGTPPVLGWFMATIPNRGDDFLKFYRLKDCR